MTYGANQPSLHIIPVVGGIGSLTGVISGKALGIGIVSPANAIYDFEIIDVDGFGVFGVKDNSGNATFQGVVRFWNQHTIYITNATNGEYKVKIWYE